MLTVYDETHPCSSLIPTPKQEVEKYLEEVPAYRSSSFPQR